MRREGVRCATCCTGKIADGWHRLGRGGRVEDPSHTISPLLGCFDQLHLAIAGTVQDHYLAFGVAEDEDVAVAEVSFFYGVFESHAAQAYRFVGADQGNLGGPGARATAMTDARHRTFS